jgi:threonylcarbamoyladenosine tRNA methylthiotransferase MtaB
MQFEVNEAQVSERSLSKESIKIREAMPHACIGVDVIVGFPGETDEHFQNPNYFLNEMDILHLLFYVFM